VRLEEVRFKGEAPKWAVKERKRERHGAYYPTLETAIRAIDSGQVLTDVLKRIEKLKKAARPRPAPFERYLDKQLG
jgi:hypothetical protein